ncbi:MAG: hypothetical protein AAF296_11140 [Pseudomonadota bacterium]
MRELNLAEVESVSGAIHNPPPGQEQNPYLLGFMGDIISGLGDLASIVGLMPSGPGFGGYSIDDPGSIDVVRVGDGSIVYEIFGDDGEHTQYIDDNADGIIDSYIKDYGNHVHEIGLSDGTEIYGVGDPTVTIAMHYMNSIFGD